jgi:CO/xanthine dehydrogenase FAD-binding subunit
MALEIVRVDSVRAAAAVLAAEDGARFIGGGTLAVRDVNYGDGSVDKLVLPDGLGLDRIVVEGDEVTLGAAVTMAKIAAHPRLAFLNSVAGSIGGPAVRAMATVGGNLFAPHPFGDFTVALLALGATVTIENLDKTETVDLETFLAAKKTPATVVRSVSFPAPPAGAFRFAKVVRRKPHGASVLSIAALLPMADRKVTDGRIAYGAMAPRPMRSRAVEKALEGNPLDTKSVGIAVKVATVGCKPLTDPQASEWYRMAVLPVHLQRLLSAGGQ